MPDHDIVVVYVATYARLEDARADFVAVTRRYAGGVVRTDDTTVIGKKLDGKLKMGRKFYPGHPEQKPNLVDATVVGVLEFGPGTEIRSLRLVTETATYGQAKFSVAVRSVPQP